MSSPFQTPQEFLEVKGPLYTFANNPFWLILFLVISVVIFFWFIFASYKINGSKSTPANPAMMSILLLTSFLSLAQSAYISGTNKIENYKQRNKSEVLLRKRTTILSRRLTNRNKLVSSGYHLRFTDRSRTIRRS